MLMALLFCFENENEKEPPSGGVLQEDVPQKACHLNEYRNLVDDFIVSQYFRLACLIFCPHVINLLTYLLGLRMQSYGAGCPDPHPTL